MDGTLLTRVLLEMYHNHYAGSKFVLEADKTVSLMNSPSLFAFCCDDDVHIDLNGSVTSFTEQGPIQGRQKNLCQVSHESKIFILREHLLDTHPL